MQPLLLLHGAIGAADQLQPLARILGASFEVHAIDFSGHGQQPLPEASFSIDLFAHDVLAYMELKGMKQASIFGYSMGGYVGMYLARYFPDRVHKVITLATKFHWDEPTAAKEVQMLDANKIAAKVPAFAEALAQRHILKDWKEVLERTIALLQALGTNNTLQPADYKDIPKEILLLLGDRDKMVSLEETLSIYKVLPAAQLGILPATPHPIEQVDTELLAYMIGRFCN